MAAGATDRYGTGLMDGPVGSTRDGTAMIVVTRLNGPKFSVNPDLLLRVESTPDTILTLIDGTKYIVAESIGEVNDLVVDYRARVVARSLDLTNDARNDPTDADDGDRGADVTQLRAVRALTSLPSGSDRG